MKVRPWSEFWGTFKVPDSAKKVGQRVSTNGLYFGANYLLIVIIAVIAAPFTSSASLTAGGSLVILHAIFKVRTISSKVNSFVENQRAKVKQLFKKKK